MAFCWREVGSMNISMSIDRKLFASLMAGAFIVLAGIMALMSEYLMATIILLGATVWSASALVIEELRSKQC